MQRQRWQQILNTNHDSVYSGRTKWRKKLTGSRCIGSRSISAGGLYQIHKIEETDGKEIFTAVVDAEPLNKERQT